LLRKPGTSISRHHYQVSRQNLMPLLVLIAPLLFVAIGSKQGSVVTLGDGPSREEFLELSSTVKSLDSKYATLQTEMQKLGAKVATSGVGRVPLAEQALVGAAEIDIDVGMHKMGRVVPQNNTKCVPFTSDVHRGVKLFTGKGRFVVNTDSLECRLVGSSSNRSSGSTSSTSSTSSGVGPLRCTFIISKRKDMFASGGDSKWAALQPQNQDVFYVFATGTAGGNSYRAAGTVGTGRVVAGGMDSSNMYDTEHIEYRAHLEVWDRWAVAAVAVGAVGAAAVWQ
jgi:hypothetical protein